MRYSTITDASGPDVIARAVEVFGPAGHGLRVTERDLLNVRLEHTLGHVALVATRTRDARTDVEIETREFDSEVRAFIENLPRYSALRRWLRRR